MSASILLLAASLACAQAPACRDAYKPEYVDLWEVSRPVWEKACEGGLEIRYVLRYLQRGFQAGCAKAFSAEIQKGRASESTVLAYCAQGVPGRRRLRGDLGLPAEARPGETPKVEGVSGPKPGSSGMGPMASAVAAAKERWAGACLMAMEYVWSSGRGLLGQNQETKRDEYRPEAYENYYYVFYSPARSGSTLLVSYGDATSHGLVTARLQGPDLEELRKSVEGTDCLVKVAVDVEQALAGARKAGLIPEGARVEAFLLSRQAWAKNRGQCFQEDKDGRRENEACPKLSKAEQRRLDDKELWVVSSGAKTVFLDAAKGERLAAWKTLYQPLNFKSLVERDSLR